MTNLVLLIGLLSAPMASSDWKFYAGPKLPSPYLGFSQSAFTRINYNPEQGDSSEFRGGGYFHIGAPFEIARWEAPYYITIPLVVTPEFFFGDDTYGMNGTVGAEVIYKTGYRHVPSSYFLGVAPGIFVTYNPKNPRDVNGGAPYRYQKVSFGLVGNVYGGPCFDLWGKTQARLMITARPMYGTIGERSFSMGENRSLALVVGASLQLKL